METSPSIDVPPLSIIYSFHFNCLACLSLLKVNDLVFVPTLLSYRPNTHLPQNNHFSMLTASTPGSAGAPKREEEHEFMENGS